MDPPIEFFLCETAIASRNAILASDYTGKLEQAFGNELRMFNYVAAVTDDAGNQDLPVR